MTDFYRDIQWTADKISRIWNYYASNPAYESQYFAHHSGASIIRYVRRRVALANKRILDFGCGPGFLLEHLIKSPGTEGSSLWGIDFSQSSVEKANKRLSQFRAFKGAHCMSQLPVDFPSGQIDVIFCVEVAEHADDNTLTAMLVEFRRLLSDGGAVVVTTPNSENLDADKTACPECGCVFNRWQHVRSWTRRSLQRTFEQAGFNTLHVAETEFRSNRHSALGLLARRLRIRQDARPHLVYIGRKC